MPEGQHELVVRFYPISKDKAETLHLFQQFKANKRYTLKMFRDRNARSTSLLNASAPDPLCGPVARAESDSSFCKPYNVINGIAEFVEKNLT